MKKNKVLFLIPAAIFLCLILVFFPFCGQEPLDYYKFNKIDAHVHVNTDKPAFLEAAVEHNFRVLTINTDVSYYPNIYKQRNYAIYQKQVFSGRIAYATTFTMEGWDEPNWPMKTVAYIEVSNSKGAIAVKLWKNIGMEFKDKDGNFVLIDNPRFDPIFKYLVKKGIPVVGHIGEPKNCWLPIEKMTVNNDKNYFQNHPEYHMFLHPEYPSYETLIDSRDKMLEKNPDLKFVGCHLGSLEWSVDELAKRLDRFPNMAVDFSARMCHLQYQTVKDRKKVYDFINKYQDQLIYGTDMFTDGTEEPEDLKAKMSEKWLSDWKYLSTDSLMIVSEVDGEFQGLALPRKVLEKVYRLNAEKWYPGI